MFAGPNARTFRKQDVIGYGRRDGLPRIYISNLGACLAHPCDELTKPGICTLPLAQLLHHPALYAAYPELKALPVTLNCTPGLARSDYSAQYVSSAGTASLTFSPEAEPQWVSEALMHETQHAIQSIEGFSNGTTVSSQRLRIGRELVHRIEQRISLASTSTARDRLLARSIAFENVLSDRIESEADHSARQRLDLLAARAYLRTPGEQEAFSAEDVFPVQLPHLRLARPAPSQIVDRDYDWAELKVCLRYSIHRHTIPLREGLSRIFNILRRKEPLRPLSPAVCHINPARANRATSP